MACFHTTSDIKGFEVVAMVKKLAKKEHSAALAQPASRISTIMKFGAGAGEDPPLPKMKADQKVASGVFVWR